MITMKIRAIKLLKVGKTYFSTSINTRIYEENRKILFNLMILNPRRTSPQKMRGKNFV